MNVVRKTLASVPALALAALVVSPMAPAAAQTAPAGGFADAQGIIVNLEVLGALPVPGPLGGSPIDPNTFARATQACPPQTAEPAVDRLLNVPAAPAVTADTVTTMAGASCAGSPVAVASAQTENLDALIQATGGVVTADVIRAQANSDCVKAPNGEGSLFVGLTVAGQAISETPDPNTEIPLPGIGTLIINEQRPTADGRGIVVNGLHLIGDGTLVRGDLVVSHANSGVVCPNGKGSEVAEGLEAPVITFDKDATPSTAQAGQTVTYNATITNTSEEPCDVISFIDHLSSVFEFVSTSGALGDAADDPAPVRGDGGQDVILRPTDVVIDAGASVKQTIVVRLKNDVAPGTYFNSLEIFCNLNGNFASGPLAPVTVPAAAPPVEPAPAELPRTGTAPLLALGALLLLGAGLGARRLAHR